MNLKSFLENTKNKEFVWSSLSCRHVSENPYHIQSFGIDVILYHFGCSYLLYKTLIQSIKYSGKRQIIFLVSEPKDEIKDFLSPQFCPNGVLFLPLRDSELQSSLVAAEISFGSPSENREEEKSFKIKVQGEYMYLRLNDIYFFEGQEKQIALRLRGQEIRFYSNFQTVMEGLDDRFIRCHKGFIVNKTKIEKIRLTEMVLLLSDGSKIPFSRTYAQQVKALVLHHV